MNFVSGQGELPRENELFLHIKRIAETMGDRLAVIRTADLGADKQAAYLNIPDETNPHHGQQRNTALSGPQKNVQGSAAGYFQGKCIWKSGYYVSHEQL